MDHLHSPRTQLKSTCIYTTYFQFTFFGVQIDTCLLQSASSLTEFLVYPLLNEILTPAASLLGVPSSGQCIPWYADTSFADY